MTVPEQTRLLAEECFFRSWKPTEDDRQLAARAIEAALVFDDVMHSFERAAAAKAEPADGQKEKPVAATTAPGFRKVNKRTTK
jgi:hypothetical protein